jgi:hypothetical protein
MPRNLILLLIFLLPWFLESQAQEFPSEVWHKGKLITTDGDTLYGLVKYDLEGDVVQIKSDDTEVIGTFSARKVSYFEIFDSLQGYYRYFYSLPYFKQQNYKVTLLFELLEEGQISLLSREAIVVETIPQYSPYYGTNFTRQKLAYTFYFLKDGKELFEFNGKKGELLRVMSKHHGEIKKFMKKNRLRTDEKKDLVRIVNYFNELENS